VESLVTLYLEGADRDKLDPILDACVANYIGQLDEDGQVDFKGKAKAFTRTYDFLASILPYTNRDWEKISIFLNFLIPKLPAPEEPDLAKGILDAIDMDSYRTEKKAALKIKDDVAPKVAADRAYQNAKENTPNTARIEHDKALARVMLSFLKDDTEIYKQFVQNESFKRFVTDMVFSLTNDK
jgi:type I restriction enzyme R subunit